MNKNISKIKKSKVKTSKDGHTYFNFFKGFKNFKKRFVPQSQLLICEMLLNTGDKEFFVVVCKGKSFELFGKKYLVDDNPKFMKYYRTFRMWGCRYHEDISIPIAEEINVNEIKNELNRVEVDKNVSASIDPFTLLNFVKTRIIEKAMAGAELLDMFGLFKILLIIQLVVSAITGLVVLHLAGVF